MQWLTVPQHAEKTAKSPASKAGRLAGAVKQGSPFKARLAGTKGRFQLYTCALDFVNKNETVLEDNYELRGDGKAWRMKSLRAISGAVTRGKNKTMLAGLYEIKRVFKEQAVTDEPNATYDATFYNFDSYCTKQKPGWRPIKGYVEAMCSASFNIRYTPFIHLRICTYIYTRYIHVHTPFCTPLNTSNSPL